LQMPEPKSMKPKPNPSPQKSGPTHLYALWLCTGLFFCARCLIKKASDWPLRQWPSESLYRKKIVRVHCQRDTGAKTDLKVRAARFFFVQTYQYGKNITNDHKLYQMATNYTKWP
jgi:hypothetical protein